MKITRLKLVNFIGIKAGMGLDEIELDFSKGNNKIVMLRGGNGSGKTTIERQLNPFKGDKGELIIDGLEGRKEIDIEDSNSKYEIVHIYSKSGQSFIKKDGVELNPNGGLGTFKQIIHSEFGIDESYRSIGSIGNNASNFIEMKPTDRKGYIAKLIGTEEYDAAFEIVKEKYNELKKDIKKVGDELTKYPEQTILETEVKALEEALAEIEQELKTLYSKTGKFETEIEHATKDMGEQTLEGINNEISSKENSISSNKILQESAVKAVGDLPEGTTEDRKEYARSCVESLQGEINALNSKIDVNNTKKANLESLISTYKNKISSTEIELKNLGDPEKIKKLIKEIEEENTKLQNVKATIKALGSDNPAIASRAKGPSYIATSIQRFKDFTDFIEKYYNELGAKNFSANKTNIAYFFDDDFEQSLTRQVTESRNVLKSKKEMLEQLQKEYAEKNEHLSDAETLKKRPSDCKIDTCPFIKMLLQYINVEKELKALSESIEATKKDLESLEIKSENLADLKSLYLRFKDEYSRVQPRDNALLSYFLREKTLIEWLDGALSDFQLSRQTVIDATNNALDALQDFKTIKATLDTLERDKTAAENSDNKVREKYLQDIDEAKSSLTKTEDEYSVLLEEGKKLVGELEAKRKLVAAYNSFIDSSEVVALAETDLKTLVASREKVTTLTSIREKAETELAAIRQRLLELNSLKASNTSKLLQAKRSLETVKELNEKLAKLNLTLNPVDLVRFSLDSKSGIPLILIDTYLVETEAIVNRLLDSAFGGRFQIKFFTSDREFAIKIISDGSVKSDVGVASQGEISIITISLCLALIQQSLRKYNVVCLDEIDGALDKTNRLNFINIINTQITAIGLEQLFIISHNDAFDTADVDLILLKDHNVDTNNALFMKNKAIIYEYKGD